MPDMNENAETQQEYFGIMADKEIEVIIKPIFTKMFKANFSACLYGIECYKKGMEYQGIKELAKENDNLIRRISYFEKQIEEMKSDVKGNLRFAEHSNNEIMRQKMCSMLLQWEAKYKE